MKKAVSLVGARPQFIKEAVVGAEVRRRGAWNHILVHSGQHYDENMSGTFFDELDILPPQYNMGVGSATHAEQTADAMCKFEKILLEEKPDMVILYGDTNTTLAGALTASKLHIPIAHVEAGPRTYNKLFPEEVNRVLTDHVSDLLFACTSLNVENLAKEGIVEGVYNVGDVMYDLYLKMTDKFTPEAEMDRYGLFPGRYIVATIHRDFNTDDKKALSSILNGLNTATEKCGLTVVLPLHPRTRDRVARFGLEKRLKRITVTDPLSYLELMSLTRNARFVVTDSGGFQKESYWAGKRGILPMPQGGWQEITDTGWHTLMNDVADADWESLISNILEPFDYPANIFGDGKAAEKIVKTIGERIQL